MKVCVLASGSKGNSAYIETGETRSLIDIGMSCSYIEKNLRSIGVEPNTIERIFLTHTHTDHTNGLRVFLKKYQPTVYLTEKMDNELDFILDSYVYFDDDKQIKDLIVLPIKTSHDAVDSRGFIFESKGKSMLYMTDTGYIHIKHHDKLKNHDMYVLESNHDVELLMKGSYPHYLKQRILSDKGHLSNKDSSYYLSEFTTNRTKKIILAHLSEENNDVNRVLETINMTYESKNKPMPDIEIAAQKERTSVIEL